MRGSNIHGVLLKASPTVLVACAAVAMVMVEEARLPNLITRRRLQRCGGWTERRASIMQPCRAAARNFGCHPPLAALEGRRRARDVLTGRKLNGRQYCDQQPHHKRHFECSAIEPRLHGPQIQMGPASNGIVPISMSANQESTSSDRFCAARAEHSRRCQQSAAKRHWSVSDPAFGGHHLVPRMGALTSSVHDHNPLFSLGEPRRRKSWATWPLYSGVALGSSCQASP